MDTNLNVIDTIAQFNPKDWEFLDKSYRYYTDKLGHEYFLLGNNILYAKDFKTNIFPHASFLKNKRINKIFQLGGQLVLSTNQGLFLDTMALLDKKEVNVFFKDHTGNFWIGTAKEGIYKMNNSFAATALVKSNYPSNVVFAYKNSKYLFFSTKDRDAYRVNNSNSKTECFFNFKNHFGVSSDTKSVFWINDNTYYNFNGLYNFSFDYILNKLTVLYHKDFEIYSRLKNVTNIFYNKDYIYFGGRECISYIPNKKSVFRDKFIYPKKLYNSSFTVYGMSLAQDSSIWFSTINGIFKIRDTMAIPQPQFGGIAFRDFIFNQNYVIGCTHSNNLLICNNYTNNKIQTDTIKSNDCVWDKLYKVNDSVLLISTNNYFRIITLAPSDNKPKYTVRLLENPFIPFQPEFLYLDSTSYYFFKNGSISKFPVDFVLQQQALPTLRYTMLKTGQKTYPITGNVELEYFESRNINILFSTVSFNHKNLTYEYSIATNKKNEFWTTIKGEELNLYKISFGKYVVKVRARTMSGEYTRPATFILVIDRPYWATWWFILGIIIVFLLIVLAIIRFYVNRVALKKGKEIKFLKSEFKALNAMMNPHFIFNALNSVQNLINKNDKESASEYVRTISDLIRQNMHNISRDLISLESEIQLVANYLKMEQLRFKNWLTYEINIDNSIESDLIMIPPLLIQPLVENALKHGLWEIKTDKGHITINIYPKDNWIYIDVIDNGKGFSAAGSNSAAHQSTALNNIRQRLAQLSTIHDAKKYLFDIDELKDASGNVIGVISSLSISDH